MKKHVISKRRLVMLFLKVGASAFGGWSNTALLLEKELVEPSIITSVDLKGAVTYAQILPGATQVAIVSNVGHQLRGLSGASLAAISYLAPVTSLVIAFSIGYFHYWHNSELMHHLGGLIAALGGIILANAYRIGGKHVSHKALWLLVLVAFGARLWLGISAVFIILAFGIGGLLFAWLYARRSA